MSAKKILANDGIDATGKALLEKAGFEVITEKVAQEKLADTLNKEDYVALTVRSATKVRKDIIDACPGLKVIGRGGVGMDNIDVEYARGKGIEVINTPAASSNSVAELVMGHLLGLVRFLHDANRKMTSEGSVKFDALKKSYAGGIEIRDKTIGIIGLGRIGQAVARLALGCGMKVVAHDPFVPEAEINVDIYQRSPIKVKITGISLEELYAQSDFITVHVPGGKLITAKEISKMKKGAILLNASRGGVIDEKDLLAALDSGHLAGAGLDVFENEPTPNSTLLAHPKISLTPHIGAATLEAQERIGVELAEKIIAALKRNS
ncbi:MAG: D-2-hydroxyacid dehydrogenase [Bacteroidia bacterium]|nr:D-2-hydroxyacid dehydrogenase [Bacteroidia bacterium]